MSLKKQAVSGIKWTSAAQVGQQVAQFATSVILARLLSPADFGLMAMALVIIGFISIFKDLGTSSAVIQQKELSEGLLSGIFWLNALIGLLFMAGLLGVAPWVAVFYKEPRVIPIVRVLSLVFFISSLSILQKSLLERRLAFSALAKIETAVMVVSSVAGIASALLGAGVWSLVIRTVVDGVGSTCLIAVVSGYRPKLQLDWRELKQVRGYSLHLTGFNIANYFSRNADYILIGRFLGAQQLGYYTLAYRLMLFPLQNISLVIGRVMLPVFSQIQDDDSRFQRAYLTVTRSIAFVAFPLMLGLMALAAPFVLTVFGSNWHPVIKLLMILAPVGMLQAISTGTGTIFQARGRTDLMFAWGIGSGILCVIAFAIGLHWGILGVALAYAIATAILMYPCFAIPFSLIHLKVRSLAGALAKPLMCGLIMFILVLLMRESLQDLMSGTKLLLTTIPAGILAYFVCSWVLNREIMEQVLAMGGISPAWLFGSAAKAS